MTKLVKKIMTLALAPVLMLSAGLHATAPEANKMEAALNDLSQELQKAANQVVAAEQPAAAVEKKQEAEKQADSTAAPVEAHAGEKPAESVPAPAENVKG